ncbi:hypothetical protein Tco_0053205 [Tanacetum coccineum]
MRLIILRGYISWKSSDDIKMMSKTQDMKDAEKMTLIENTTNDEEERNMTMRIKAQVQATQEIKDTHVTLTPIIIKNPEVNNRRLVCIITGFVSNMLNPNQDTGVDDIFGQHTKATSLIDTPVNSLMEPFLHMHKHSSHQQPNPLVIQTSTPTNSDTATTTSSSLHNLPNFASDVWL